MELGGAERAESNSFMADDILRSWYRGAVNLISSTMASFSSSSTLPSAELCTRLDADTVRTMLSYLPAQDTACLSREHWLQTSLAWPKTEETALTLRFHAGLTQPPVYRVRKRSRGMAERMAESREVGDPMAAKRARHITAALVEDLGESVMMGLTELGAYRELTELQRLEGEATTD